MRGDKREKEASTISKIDNSGYGRKRQERRH